MSVLVSLDGNAPMKKNGFRQLNTLYYVSCYPSDSLIPARATPKLTSGKCDFAAIVSKCRRARFVRLIVTEF
jgi:hypothetical protein